MEGVGSLDRTSRRIAAGGSLIAGALAVYWLIELLRNQVPAIGAHDVQINIVWLWTLAVGFAFVARRPEISNKSTLVPFMIAPQTAIWASLFVFKWSHLRTPNFGRAGVMSFAITVALAGVAIFVRERRRQNTAQP
jgi:hypothetical protein